MGPIGNSDGDLNTWWKANWDELRKIAKGERSKGPLDEAQIDAALVVAFEKLLKVWHSGSRFDAGFVKNTIRNRLIDAGKKESASRKRAVKVAITGQNTEQNPVVAEVIAREEAQEIEVSPESFVYAGHLVAQALRRIDPAERNIVIAYFFPVCDGLPDPSEDRAGWDALLANGQPPSPELAKLLVASFAAATGGVPRRETDYPTYKDVARQFKTTWLEVRRICCDFTSDVGSRLKQTV